MNTQTLFFFDKTLFDMVCGFQGFAQEKYTVQLIPLDRFLGGLSASVRASDGNQGKNLIKKYRESCCATIVRHLSEHQKPENEELTEWLKSGRELALQEKRRKRAAEESSRIPWSSILDRNNFDVKYDAHSKIVSTSQFVSVDLEFVPGAARIRVDD
ncbi:hypothetical protein CYMTET_39606 [Cymbomonas tetramitiformis]|uniref:Uncharacterized protein n=1 Tax=Cymbomonas tetramitiformis TaxID=36881 RepID=A0AAE0F4I2_9CHLO|nr:hypothetical protein CYMTET_39606 [Cymbomonas tetramitiformis]